MKNFVIGLSIFVWLLAGVGATTLAQEVTPEDGTSIITAPQTDSELFGLVEIRGTASHPTQFAGYVLEWSNAQNPDVWLPIQQPIEQQVIDNILGVWDTTANSIPDGVYQIRLRVLLQDDSVQDAIVRNLRVANTAPTPIATVPPLQPTATLPFGNAQGSAPLIQQPPTATARPTFEPPNTSEATPSDTTATTDLLFFDLGAVQAAICNGFFFSLGIFGMIIAYLLIRHQISPFTRRLWWQIRSEIDDNRQ